ncbi:NAD-dependent epimerase/dehydratase family protein [Candidatus Woesearchaeota archaeon]|nr:NAD-dependent epimerase/dehydratase family protein [Candidatus Woesearchaeota archaeon]
MSKKILVTGGAGFIGSHLCKFLLEKGDEVICMDNFFTGSKKNIQPLMKYPNFDLLRHDIIQPIYLEVDQIYNLACPASPPHYQWDPIKTTLTSTVGIYNMLGIAKRCKARILQASTSEVYGDPKEHPQKETYRGNVNCLGPRSCYDEGKRCAETFMMDYKRENNVDIRIARIFNTYGPNMAKEDGRVVSNFIIQALNNYPITVYGDGSQTRSFQYITDLIKGLYSLMNKENFTGPVNLGNPDEFTILELAEKVIEKTNSSSKITYKPLPEDDPLQRKPDITLAKEKLDWQPKIKLEQGLKETIEYFKNGNSTMESVDS